MPPLESTTPAYVSSELDDRYMHLLENNITRALTSLDGQAELMPRMVHYHLGLIDAGGSPTSDDVRHTVQGKRIRPKIAMLAAEAVGGTADAAAPLAAAIELLHNFTLIHDDIQDRSPNRRHRPTVWRIWGNAQAINAGDALFAVSHLAMLHDASPEIAVRLMEALNRCTIEIVRGQVMDLENEGQKAISPAHYLDTIRGKTAAILRFAAWGGALLGGATDEIAEKLGDVGENIGMGFQIRDDILGIWAPAEETGKDTADDIRRRKQTLPILILRERATEDERVRVDDLYRQDEINGDGICAMLDLLVKYDVRASTEAHATRAHDEAIAALADALPDQTSEPIQALLSLIRQLNSRTS